MSLASTIKKIPTKNIRLLRKRKLSKKYSFVSSEIKSPFKIELRVVSPKEQEQRRNPAYTYFSID